MTEQNKTFIKITNKEIYTKLEIIEEKLTKIRSKVNTAFWISTTSLSISLLIIAALLAVK